MITDKLQWQDMVEAPEETAVSSAPPSEMIPSDMMVDAHYYLSKLIGRTASNMEIKAHEGRLALCEFIPDAVRQNRVSPINSLDPLLVVPLFDVSIDFARHFQRLTAVQQDWVRSGGTYKAVDVGHSHNAYRHMLNEIAPNLTADEIKFYNRWMRSIISRPGQHLTANKVLSPLAMWGICLLIFVVTYWVTLLSIFYSYGAF